MTQPGRGIVENIDFRRFYRIAQEKMHALTNFGIDSYRNFNKLVNRWLHATVKCQFSGYIYLQKAGIFWSMTGRAGAFQYLEMLGRRYEQELAAELWLVTLQLHGPVVRGGWAMFYKGEGLDLRVSGGRASGRYPDVPTASGAAGSGWLSRVLDDTAAGPTIWVDDLAMQCFNQAYDLAVAHRAPEVGLEHLIHAMTLIEATAGVLHRYNIHVSALRKESASIIAADAPVGRVAAGSAPRPSEELEELLELAAERAHGQRVPVTTEAILDTLFDMKRDLSSRTRARCQRLQLAKA